MSEAQDGSLCAVVPVLNDDRSLGDLLEQLREFDVPALVVDGADSAATAALVASYGARYLPAARGRGVQIRAGCCASDAAMLWVLHADSRVSAACANRLRRLATGVACWGRFDVEIEGLAVIAWFMNWRSRLSRICTGDQGLFFHRALLDSVGGFPALPLMEDIEVSKLLKRARGSHFVAPSERISTSPRRWRQHGVVRTVLTMWWYRLRYFAGAPAQRLYEQYYS